MVDRIGVVYAENKSEMSWSIELSAIYDKTQTG